MNPFDHFTIAIISLEKYLEDQSIIIGEYKVKAAIARYLNKRGNCIMNINTITRILEDE